MAENSYENKRNLNYGSIGAPKSKYDFGDLVVYNKLKRFGDENDELLLITGKKYGNYKPGKIEKEWFYTGIVFKEKNTNSKGLPRIPLESLLLYEITEDFLISREELLNY